MLNEKMETHRYMFQIFLTLIFLLIFIARSMDVDNQILTSPLNHAPSQILSLFTSCRKPTPWAWRQILCNMRDVICIMRKLWQIVDVICLPTDKNAYAIWKMEKGISEHVAIYSVFTTLIAPNDVYIYSYSHTI